MRRRGTEVTAERLQNTIGLRCEGTAPERGRDAGEGEGRETCLICSYHCRAWRFVAFCFVNEKANRGNCEGPHLASYSLWGCKELDMSE